MIQKCRKCSGKLEMDDLSDAYYCPECDEWFDATCSDRDWKVLKEDPECLLCVPTPSKPSNKPKDEA